VREDKVSRCALRMSVKRNVYKYFVGKTEGKRLLEDLNIHGKLILK
jgi:hypothetical protein